MGRCIVYGSDSYLERDAAVWSPHGFAPTAFVGALSEVEDGDGDCFCVDREAEYITVPPGFLAEPHDCFLAPIVGIIL